MSTLTELWDRLDKHDWFHEMSDDHRCWVAGTADWKLITLMAEPIEGGPELMKAFTTHYYTGEPWGNVKQPKPTRPEDTMATYDKQAFPNMIDGDPVSELKVMHSAAGYYIGRSYSDLEYGFEGPYSRESGYMSKANAINAMRRLDDNKAFFEVRDCIENNEAYDKGTLPDLRMRDTEREVSLAEYDEMRLYQEEEARREQREDEEQAWHDRYGS